MPRVSPERVRLNRLSTKHDDAGIRGYKPAGPDCSFDPRLKMSYEFIQLNKSIK